MSMNSFAFIQRRNNFAAPMLKEISLLLLFTFSVRSDHPNTPQSQKNEKIRSSAEICRRELGHHDLTTFEGMAGMGWDNLLNLEMAEVLDLTFEKCLTTPDGKYLVPDDMQIYPIKKINLVKMANFHEHYQSYFTSRTEKINLEAGYSYGHFGISGSFSTTNQESKERFAIEKSSLLHTSLDYKAYTAMVQGQTRLHPTFKERLLAINDAYINGLPRRARYLAELMIRDYGTHVITRTELGAVIEQEDYVESNIREHQEIRFSEVRAAASASFLSSVGVFSGGISYSTQTYTKSKEHFENSLKHTQIKSRGGPNVNRLFSVEPGSNTSHLLVDDLVVIDRSGVPLFTLINEQTMRGSDHATITRISNAIRNATETYYRMNKIQGCMDPRAQNFDLRANVNGSCIPSYHNDTIGGVYQKCLIVPAHEGDEYVAGFYPHEQQQSLCANFTQKNGATGDFSCPDFHEPIELFHGNIGIPHLEIPYCWQKCSTFNGGFFTKKYNCRTYCGAHIYKYYARIETYYCRAKPNVMIPKDTSFLFGGLFRQGQVNLFTGSAACPGYFQEYRVFRDTIICLSRNYQTDSIYEIKLDRFFSCQQPREDQRCAEGYTQHMVTTENGCDVFFCVKPDQLNRYLRVMIKSPPFEDETSLSNDTQNTIYFYHNETFWHKENMTMLIEEAVKMLVKRGQVSNLLGNQSHPRVSLKHFDEFIRDDYVPEFIKMEKELFDDHGTDGSSINASTMAYIGGTAVGVIITVALIGFAFRRYRNRSTHSRLDSQSILQEIH